MYFNLLSSLFIFFVTASGVAIVENGTSRDLPSGNATQMQEPMPMVFMPSIANAHCGDNVATSFKITYMPDEFDLAEGCRNLLNHIGGNSAKSEVDVMFICPGEPGDGFGADPKKLKFGMLLHTFDMRDGIDHDVDIASGLEVIDQARNTVFYLDVVLHAKKDDNGFHVKDWHC